MNNNFPEKSALLTIQEAAKILGVSTKTLRRWDKAGILVPNRTIGNQRRYLREKIEVFTRSRTLLYSPSETSQIQEPLKTERQAGFLPKANPIQIAVVASGTCIFLILLGIHIGTNILLKSDIGKGNLGSGFKGVTKQTDQSGENIGKGLVLGTATPKNEILLNVNASSSFNNSAVFLEGIKAAKIATLSGGIITEDQDINAGTGTLTASNVLYGATAGTGISVSTGQRPAITNTDLGSSQNIFKTIKVGSDSFSSGSNTDTLEFSAGTGISLSADKSNKKVTITGSATSGWTDDGTAVRLTTSSDSVGIGLTSPSSKLDVLATSEQLRLLYDTSNYTSFTISSSGDLTLNPTGGDIVLGDADVLNIGGSGSDTAYNIIGDASSGASSVVDSDDDLYIEGNIEIDGTVRLNNVSYTFPSADGSNTNVLTTNGSGTLSWSSSGGGSNWSISSGAISPINSTLDLLVGSTATSSAKFAVLNVNSGTPTASVSAGVAGGAYLSATGTLATTAMQTLTLGGSTTGNITIDSGTSSITLSDDTTISGDLAVNGATSADITSTTTTGTLFNTTVTTLSLGGAATTLSIGASTGTTTVNNALTVTGAGTFNNTFTNTNGTTSNSLINLTSSGDFVLQDAGVTVVTFTDAGILTLASQAPTEGSNFVALTNTAGSGTSYDMLDISLTSASDDAGADTQRAASLTITGPTDTEDTTVGLAIVGGTASGGTEVAIDIPAITAGAGTETAIRIGSGWDNVLDSSSLDISGAGVVSGATGITSSGTITFSGLTASRFVVTDASSNLAATAASSVLLNTLTDETGTGVAVFGTSPTITTSLITDSTTFALVNTTATTVDFAGAATTLNLGTTDSVTRTINLGTGTGADTINIGTGGTTADAITLGNTGVATTLAFNTGVTTGTGFAIAANSVTSGNTLTLSSTGMTTGEILDLTGTWAPTDGSTNEAIDINITHTPTTIADNFRSIDLDTSDGTALGNTVYNYDGTLTLTGNAAKTGYGIYQTVTSNSTTADTIYSLYAANSVTGAISTGTRNTYGLYSNPAQSGANTGGTSNLYGAYFNPSSTASTTGSTVNVYGTYITNTGTLTTGGTINSYGLYVANGSSDTIGTSTKYGLYVESPTGADTNYAAIFAGGNVGIGTSTPDSELEVEASLASSDINIHRNEGAGTIAAVLLGTINFVGTSLSSTNTGASITAEANGTWSGATDSPGLIRIYTVPDGGNTLTQRMIIMGGGDIGIGTETSPDTRVDINITGAANNGITISQTNAGDYDPFIDFQLADGTTLFRLGVDDSVAGDPFKISTTALGTGDTLTIDSRTTTSGVSTITLAGIAPTIASAAGAEYTTLTVTPPTITLTGGTQVTSVMDSLLINAPTITDTTAITIDKAATVTIGGNPTAGGSVTITAPRALNVDGRVEINLAGTQTSVALCGSHAAAGGASVSDVEIVDCTGTPGADYMEIYAVEKGVETGDIVVTGTTSVKTTTGDTLAQLIKSSKPYGQNIIGIVSDPKNAGDFNSIGYNIKPEDNPLPIALNGRVQVKVSLENGPIGTGDYLTSSSTPGVAMKATKPGQVIGMALESYDGNTSEVCRGRNTTSEVEKQCTGKILIFINPHWQDPSIYIAADGSLVNQSLADSSTETASTSAQTTFDLAKYPTFQDLQNKVDLLESKIDFLSLMVNNASTSAPLKEIGDIGGIGETMEIETATVSGSLMVLGRTTVTDIGVTGDINAGVLSIHGLIDDTSEVCRGCVGATINTLSGNLYLQNQGLGGIDILNGKIVIDKDGTLIVNEKITAKAIEVEEFAVKAGKSIGTGFIESGKTSVEVVAESATSSSKIFITPTSVTDKQLAVTAKADGKFRVEILEADAKPITFDWWIVGNN